MLRYYDQVSSFDEQSENELNSDAIGFRAASEFFKPTRKQTQSRRILQTPSDEFSQRCRENYFSSADVL
jgi:hypothetical protein